MNHIAHFLLAPHTGRSAIGTLLADFQRGPIASTLPAEIGAAIALHRAVDSYTDAHPATHAAKALFAADARRYAGVAIDLYFDHCLVCEWKQYSDEPFARFIDATHARLAEGLAAPYVPERMRRMATAMRNEEWLGAYAEFDGIERALGRLNHAVRYRFQREVELRPLADELKRLQPELDSAFAVLFPDVKRFATERKEQWHSAQV
ncbi:MAG: ACP phosphodiesterase [Betaproteobacteria bacterium]